MAPVDIVAKANWPFENPAKWALSTYEGQVGGGGPKILQALRSAPPY
jgi:hypothetical protein